MASGRGRAGHGGLLALNMRVVDAAGAVRTILCSVLSRRWSSIPETPVSRPWVAVFEQRERVAILGVMSAFRTRVGLQQQARRRALTVDSWASRHRPASKSST